MKRKTILRILAAVTMAAAMTTTIAFVGCSKEEPVEPPQNEQTNNNGNNNNNNPSNPSNPSNPNTPSTPGDTDTAPTVKTYLGGTETALSEDKFEKREGKWYFKEALTASDITISAGQEFSGWYADKACTQQFDFDAEVATNTIIYALVYENVNTEFDFTSAMKSYPAETRFTEPTDIGKFTFTASARFQTNEGGCVNTGGTNDIFVKLSGANNGNTLTFKAKGASSNSPCTLTVYNEETSSDILFTGSGANGVGLGTDASDTITISNLPAGTYVIHTAGSARVWDMKLTEKLAVSAPTGLRVSGGITDYVLGDELITAGFNVYLQFENGREDPVIANDFDSSALDAATEPGEYEIIAKYTDKDNNQFTGKFTVTAYEVTKVEIGKDATSTGTQSAAGNSIYKNNSVQELYFVGDTFNPAGFTVSLTGRAMVGGQEVTKVFYDRKADDKLTITTPSTGALTKGKQTLTATYGTGEGALTDSFSIFVVDSQDLLAQNQVTLKVSPETTEADIATLSTSESAYQFQTIQQALDFLKLLNLDEATQKIILLDEGTYKEKLEIDIPNITLVASNQEASATDPSKMPTIEWDSLFGLPDASGFTQATDSTATLNIRDTAVGFRMMGIRVNNKWCTQEVFDDFDATRVSPYGEHRALAVLIMADKVFISDCEFNGYQDTIELFTGRQVITNTLITGTTDFIFGTNNTTYFYGCEIRSIVTDKNTSGGYITAFKGNNKNADDAVKYGAIFDNCKFTCDEGVQVETKDAENHVLTKGVTALGRTWGSYSAVAVINSELGGHISKEGWDGSSTRDLRYVKMNEAPDAATVKFVEYNNRGDGAISTAVRGMKMLADATEASKYSLISSASDSSITINPDFEGFGTENGYASDWVIDGENPSGIEVVEITIKVDTEEVARVNVVKGKVANITRLIKAVPANKIQANQEVVGFTYMKQGAETDFTAATVVTEAMTLTAKLDTKKVYERQSWSANDLTESGKDFCQSEALFSFTLSDNNFVLQNLTYPAKADDSSNLTFTKALFPNGGSKSVTVTAKKDIDLVIYYTASDGSFQSSEGYAKSGNLQWTIGSEAQQTSSKTENKKNNVAYSQTVHLDADATVVFSLSGNRFVLFGITASHLVTE